MSITYYLSIENVDYVCPLLAVDGDPAVALTLDLAHRLEIQSAAGPLGWSQQGLKTFHKLFSLNSQLY